MTPKRNATTVTSLVISQETADQDVDQGLFQWTVTAAEADIHVPGHQEKDATIETIEEDHLIVAETAMIVEMAMTVITGLTDAMTVTVQNAVGTAQIVMAKMSGVQGMTTEERRAEAERRIEEEERVQDVEVLKSEMRRGDLLLETTTVNTSFYFHIFLRLFYRLLLINLPSILIQLNYCRPKEKE